MRRTFIVIVVVLLIALYLQYYAKYKHDYQILQVYLDKFKLDTLYEKYPIVVYDQVYDTNDILKTIFAYSYVFRKDLGVTPGQVTKNNHKYLVLSSDEDVSIKIINPKYKKDIKAKLEESNVQYVTIKLKENQVLILPAKWYFYTDNDSVFGIGLDDLVSKWFYSVF